MTVKTIKKKQKHKGRGTVRTITKQVPNDSFFNFFSPLRGEPGRGRNGGVWSWSSGELSAGGCPAGWGGLWAPVPAGSPGEGPVRLLSHAHSLQAAHPPLSAWGAVFSAHLGVEQAAVGR